MSFISKLWKDRVSDYPNKRKLTKEDGTSETVTVERAEGDIVVAGDAFNAENMNDLETRIQNGFNAVEQAQTELTEKLNSLHFGSSNQTNYVTVNLSEIQRGVYLLFNTSSGGFNGWILVNYDNKNIFSLDNKDVNSDSTIKDGVLMLNCGTWYADIWGFSFS